MLTGCEALLALYRFMVDGRMCCSCASASTGLASSAVAATSLICGASGVDADAAGARPEYDPSYSVIQGPYTAALNHYVRTDLGYESDLPYEILTDRVHPWDYSDFQGRYIDVADRLRSAMVKNPNMRVFVASGYFDLATPHFAADYVVDHLDLEPDFQRHVETEYYEAGHMMYINSALRKRLSEDVREWMRSTIQKQ